MKIIFYPPSKLLIHVVCFLPLLLIGINSTNAQLNTIWFECFDTNDQGITGNCNLPFTDISNCATNIPSSNNKWSIIGDVSGLESENDFVKVINQQLVGQNLDGELCFNTEMIDISGYDDIQFSLNIMEDGDLESSDYVDVKYKLDGDLNSIINWMGEGSSSHTLTGENGVVDGGWNQALVCQNLLLGGSTLEIIVCMKNNSLAERFLLDNVSVTGLGRVLIPSMSQWALFIFSLVLTTMALVYIKKNDLIFSRYS